MNIQFEEDINRKFHDICRLCASYKNDKISLFSNEGKRRKLKDKIQSCLPFKVEEHDAFPKCLCLICVESLESLYEFRHKCIQVNRNLEKHLQKEKEKQVQFSGYPRRIRPEVSIFALPPTGRSTYNQNAEEIVRDRLSVDSKDTPNPLDFLEVGVNSEDATSNHRENDGKQQFSWNLNNQWMSIEQKPFCNVESEDRGSKSNFVETPPPPSILEDNGLNRRKNNNPRKIARDSDDGVNENRPSVLTSSSMPGLISLSITPNNSNLTRCNSSANHNADPNATKSSKSSSSFVVSNYDQKHACLLCENYFSEPTALKKHYSTFHGIEPHEMLNQSSFQGHSSFGGSSIMDEELAESMVEQETVVSCEVCRREFQDKASLWLHMVHAHREEASLSCGICLMIFSDSITLIEHVNTAHSQDKATVQRRYSCQVCGRQHDSRQKLLKHASLHTLIDNQGQAIQPEEMISLNNAFAPRECPYCHKKFFSHEKMEQHILNFHNDSNNLPSVVFRCELCDSTHASRIDRWWHMFHSHGNDKRVSCDVGSCRKIFASQAIKEDHRINHHVSQGEFTNTCEVCGKMWESKVVFYKHMMNVHPKCLPSVCGVCMKIFSNVPELRHHVKVEHAAKTDGTNGICCDVCGRAYTERSKMLRHRRVHNVTDGVPYTPNMIDKRDELQCSICPDLLFETIEEIGDHRRSVHQLFVCDLCPKFYNGNNHLWKHVSKQHKGDPSVTCNICFKTSASRAHLHRHKLKYHSDPVEKLMSRNNVNAAVNEPHIYKCELCSREFRIRSLLNKHAKTCKGAKPITPKFQSVNGVFPCSKCNRVFEQQGVLSKHMKSSHVVYFCEGCAKTDPKQEFDKKSLLLQHIKEKHTNDPEFFCDVDGCGKVLRVKADLQKHKLEHTRGYITYICDFCGDTFSNRKKLRKHLLTFHKADVKHLCAVCVAMLPTVEELALHVQTTHPMLLFRPFTCQICGKCWSASSKAVDHVTKAHGTQFKPCKICWKVFTDDEELERHTKNHPPVEEKPVAAAKKDSFKANISNKSYLPKELSALGIVDTKSQTGEKRLAENKLEFEDGKRLRKKYRCQSCNDSFRSIIELNQHKVEKHQKKDDTHSNKDNNATNITTATSVEENIEEIDPKSERWTDMKPVACGCCPRIWNSKKQLWQHLIRSHPYEAMYTCGICLKVCQNYLDLNYHLDRYHLNAMNNMSTKFSCPVCGHYHNSQSKLDTHVLVHRNATKQQESHRCHHCQKVFRSMVFFREHQRTHESKSGGDLKVRLKREPSELSGFSIKNILSKKDGDIKKERSNGNDIEIRGDDIKLDPQDDDDMIELEDGDGEMGNYNVKEEKVFKGYENDADDSSEKKVPKLTFVNISGFSRVKDEVQMEEENDDIDLESNISCSTIVSDEENEDDDDMDSEEIILNGDLVQKS